MTSCTESRQAPGQPLAGGQALLLSRLHQSQAAWVLKFPGDDYSAGIQHSNDKFDVLHGSGGVVLVASTDKLSSRRLCGSGMATLPVVRTGYLCARRTLLSTAMHNAIFQWPFRWQQCVTASCGEARMSTSCANEMLAAQRIHMTLRVCPNSTSARAYVSRYLL